jgi:CubicO group peptidase (beta-lactamase class C family)
LLKKYDTGFSKDAKLLGWSMTKSITATIFGLRETRGSLILLNSSNLRGKMMPVKKITTNDLLHMSASSLWRKVIQNM